MEWTDAGTGGVLIVPLKAQMEDAPQVELHVLLLAGQTWAYWESDGGTWLGLASVGQA